MEITAAVLLNKKLSFWFKDLKNKVSLGKLELPKGKLKFDETKEECIKKEPQIIVVII